MRSSSIAAILALLLPMFLLTGCGGDDAIRDDGPDAETLYEEARGALAARSYDQAISLYRALTVRFPFGRHAEQALLDMAYA